MSARAARQLVAASYSTLLTLTLIGCASATPSRPASQSPASPLASAPASASPSVSASGPAPSATLGPVVTVEELVADLSATDGDRVRVDGFFLATGNEAQLCSVVLESYPPQCGGATVRVTGQVPADVLDGLFKTQEPELAQAAWGWVIVTGTFTAAGPDGRPTLAIERIELHEG